MAIKRYYASKTTTITNSYKSNLLTRATGSNGGMSDSVAIFSIYGQASSTSSELARALFDFPVATVVNDRASGDLPASGSVNFYLNLYNSVHPFTVPRKITLSVQALSQSFDEGHGLDTDGWTDSGIANWEQASSGSSGINSWVAEGGDFYQNLYTPGSTLPTYTYYMPLGIEDMSLDVTSLVEEWAADSTKANGLGVFLTSSIETAASSSYLKKFLARGSEFFYKRPHIEARWNDAVFDDRNRFYASSSLLSDENTNHLTFYNYARGYLRDVSGYSNGSSIYVKLYTDPSGGVDLTPTPITASWVSTGVYTASVALDTTASAVYDRWYGTGLTPCFATGSMISVYNQSNVGYNPNTSLILSVENLRDEYSIEEKPRFRVFTRQKGWSPTIYSISSGDAEVNTIYDLYYRVTRTYDDYPAIEFGTGSAEHTKCSYDLSGSYFDLEMNLLEPGYMYELSFARKKENSKFEKLKSKFRFRVEE